MAQKKTNNKADCQISANITNILSNHYHYSPLVSKEKNPKATNFKRSFASISRCFIDKNLTLSGNKLCTHLILNDVNSTVAEARDCTCVNCKLLMEFKANLGFRIKSFKCH